MSVHLTTFKTPFGSSKAENQNYISKSKNIAIFVVKQVLKKHSGVIVVLVYNKVSKVHSCIHICLLVWSISVQSPI